MAQNKKTKTNRNNPSNAPARGAAASGRDSADDKPAIEDSDAADSNENPMKDLKKPTFWVNVITLIVVGIYTCFACQQVNETQTANSIARKALTEVNKPYVMFAGMHPNYVKDNFGNLHLRMGVGLTNVGNTPANYVKPYNCDPIVRDDDVAPQFNCIISQRAAEESVLGPKQGFSMVGPEIKDADFDATKDEKKAIYVFGGVTYYDEMSVDTHGVAEQRETRFCARVIKPIIMQLPNMTTSQTEAPKNIPQTATLPAAPGSVILIGCPAFSCVDKTCRPLRK